MTDDYLHAVERGIQLWRHIALMQDQWMLTTQSKPQRDNKQFWDGFLHQLSNDDWVNILHVFGLVRREQNLTLKDDQWQGYESCCEALNDWYHVPRCLDINDHRMRNKPKQWRMIMILREVYNQINGIDEDQLLAGQPQGITPTPYERLFDVA